MWCARNERRARSGTKNSMLRNTSRLSAKSVASCRPAVDDQLVVLTTRPTALQNGEYGREPHTASTTRPVTLDSLTTTTMSVTR